MNRGWAALPGGDCCDDKTTEIAALVRRNDRRQVLYIVLTVNLGMFVAEVSAAWWAQSTALLADSVDMLGDAAVYALSIFVVTRSLRWRSGAAAAKGVILLAFGLVVFWSAARALAGESNPSGSAMSIFGIIALIANLTCLALLWRFRADDVNMVSTFECSRNDVTANVGVIVAGAAVATMGAAWPDIAVGLIIAAVILRSAVRTLAAAIPGLRRREQSCSCAPGCACCAA